jgi:hypothetical protein
LRHLISLPAAFAALLCGTLLGAAGMAIAAAPNTALVSVAADPFGMGRVYNLPNAATAPVNLLTGDMQFTLPLGSVGGRNGLGYMVSARYSSNVMTQASTWNGDQPTGAMGLGWTIDYPKVMVDTHGQTQQAGNDYNSPGMLKQLSAKLAGQSWPIYQQTLYYDDAPAGYRTFDGRIGRMTQLYSPSAQGSTQSQGTLD